MIIITPGHKYLLDNFEDSGTQIISFVHKETDGKKLQTVVQGTTNEEVLLMLINRLNYLQGQLPCRENALAITKLEEALMWLEKRTANRLDRGVEGSSAA